MKSTWPPPGSVTSRTTWASPIAQSTGSFNVTHPKPNEIAEALAGTRANVSVTTRVDSHGASTPLNRCSTATSLQTCRTHRSPTVNNLPEAQLHFPHDVPVAQGKSRLWAKKSQGARAPGRHPRLELGAGTAALRRWGRAGRSRLPGSRSTLRRVATSRPFRSTATRSASSSTSCRS